MSEVSSAFVLRDDATGERVAAARGGARVRAVSTAVRSGSLGPIAGMRPRSFLWVTGSSVSAAAAANMASAVAQHLASPNVLIPLQVAELPLSVGALDLVLVSCEDAADPAAARALALAVRRGATVILDGPWEGPLRQTAIADIMLLTPAANDTGSSALRHFAAGVAVIAELSDISVDLDSIADRADEMLAACGPDASEEVNPSYALAKVLAETNSVIVGDDVLSQSVGAYIRLCASRAGVCVVSTSVADAAATQQRMRLLGKGVSAEEDLFYDSEIDGPSRGWWPSYLGLLGGCSEEFAVQRSATLGHITWLHDLAGQWISSDNQVKDLANNVVAQAALAEAAAALLALRASEHVNA